MKSHRSSNASNNKKNDASFVPPVEVNKDTVYIKPSQSFTKNQDFVTPAVSRQAVEGSAPPPPSRGLPWWQKALIAVAAIGVIIGGGFYYFKKRGDFNQIKMEEKAMTVDIAAVTPCKQGWYLQNGKCIKCPNDMVYDGKACVARADNLVEKTVKVLPLEGTAVKGDSKFGPDDLKEYIHRLRVKYIDDAPRSHSHHYWEEPYY